MKNRFLKGALLVYVMSLMVACSTNKPESASAEIDIEQIKQEIQAKENEFAETYNAGEMKSIGYYADDAVSFTQNSPPLVGKEEIVNYLKASLDSGKNENKISFTTIEVFVSNDAKLVVEFGSYKVVDPDNTVVNSGNYMSLFEKRDGKYVTVRDMSTSSMPN